MKIICEVMNAVPASESMLSEVAKLINIVLTVPATTATAERTFSTLRHLKSYLRSSVTQARLNNLHTHKENTDKFDIL